MNDRLHDDPRAALRDRIARAHSAILAPGTAADSIAPRSDRGPAALSFAQQRLWFLDQLVPGNPFYNIPAALPLRLAVDEAALRRALSEIVRRHEALRTTFEAGPEGPRQCVGAPYDPSAPAADLSRLPEAERLAALERLATDEARTPFDLACGPLVRARLVRLAPAEHVLLLTMHHIVSDGWSMGVFFRELTALYEAFARGAPSPLAEPPIQYADYAAWQRRTLTPQRMEASLAYWRTQLAGLPTLALLTDRPRPPIASFRGAFFDVAFDAGLSAALEALARTLDATLFQVLLAGFKAVLARHAGQTDVVVGAPIANRRRPELEGLVGFFVNSLTLRTRLDGDPSFAEIVARVRHTAIAAYEHQDLPFEKLVEELQPTRDLSRNPLAQVTFQIQNAPGAQREKPVGLDQIVRVERATAIFDMAFSLWETQGGLVGGIEYATDIFDAASVATLVTSLRRVLQAVVADPALRLSELPLADAALLRGDRQALPAQGLFEAFRAACEAAPDAPVLFDAEGTVSRGTLLREAGALAGAMAARGVGPGGIVALALPRGRRFVTAMLAALDAGAAWLPIDPAAPPQRLQHMLAQARPQLVLREGDAGTEALFAERTNASPRTQAHGDAAAYVLFTSGSTGIPKGVVVSHAALCNHMAWMRAELPLAAAGGRVLQRTPLHFDAAVWELWAPLLGDGQLLLPAPFEPADTGALLAAIDTLQASVLQTVPSLLRVLLDDPAAARGGRLQRVCIGGEALGGDLVAKVRARWPGAEIVNLYGPTEATIDASWWRAAGAVPADTPVPVGRPVWNLCLSVRDAAGHALPAGVMGEIWIAGAGLAQGYLGQPEATAARFVADADGLRHYRSGDLGWIRHDGQLSCAGRLDQQVKVRGNRVELGDVEAALAAHPAVQAAAVLAVPDAAGAPELVAFVTVDSAALRGDAEADRLERSHVAEWQALYQAVYAPSAATADAVDFDTVGWTSSYDGQPIAATAMRDWLDATLARLRALRPRRVLEIGCGAGLIATALAPRCQRYLGCDFSAPALARAERALAALTPPPGVRLLHCAAHEIGPSAGGERGFDLAIANSVVQYFPSLSYLVDVLRQAQALLTPSGRFFVGDVRHDGLLDAFHADVQLARADGAGTAGALREKLRAAVAQDKELLIAPAWFWTCEQALPGVGRTAVRLKRGHVGSEMLAWRYDVLLEAGPPVAPPPLAWHDWQRGGFTLADIGARLVSLCKGTGTLGLASVPNARVRQGAVLQALLADAPATQPLAALRETLRGALAATPAVDPEALAATLEAQGWAVELLPSATAPDAFDAVVHRGTLSPFEADAAALARRAPPRGRLASNPLLATIGASLEQRLRAHLAEHLPAALVPTRIEPLAELPRLANGKADRGALAALAAHRRSARTVLAAPDDALQALLADIWADVLRLKRVGIDDHFFNELGGHSLLATQVVSRVREALEIELPLRLLFEQPTVRRLAQALVETQEAGPALVEMAALLREVGALGEDELDRLLQAGPEEQRA